MFHIDATFGDLRMTARQVPSEQPEPQYSVEFHDNMTGISRAEVVSISHLSMIFAINFHPDGTPEGIEDMYKELEPLLIGWPQELRPIP